MLKYALIFALFTHLIGINAVAKEQFVCNTNKHTAVINLQRTGEFRYMSWNKPKNISQIPDMVVHNGEEIVEGTGICRYILWKFTNGNVQYHVSTLGCGGDIMPPKNAIGDLSVYINGELKKTWWCFD